MTEAEENEFYAIEDWCIAHDINPEHLIEEDGKLFAYVDGEEGVEKMYVDLSEEEPII